MSDEPGETQAVAMEYLSLKIQHIAGTLLSNLEGGTAHGGFHTASGLHVEYSLTHTDSEGAESAIPLSLDKGLSLVFRIKGKAE